MDRPTRSPFSRVFCWFVVALLGVMMSSCGGDSATDSIFLYVINGYSGASKISLYGPTGKIVQGLPFGERNGEKPIEVDRTLGTEFTLVVDGVPEPVELRKELFALYPQETATLFFKRRAGDTTVNTSLFRHVQTIDDACAVTFSNGLDLNNSYLTELSGFSYAVEFKIEDENRHGYFDESTVPVVTECGPLPTPTPDPIPRPGVLEAIEDEPWFYFVECPTEGSDLFVCYQWGDLFENETVVGPPPTAEYMECVSEAVEVRQEQQMGQQLPFPASGGEVQCPEGELTWDDVQIDTVKLRECKKSKEHSGDTVEPGTDEERFTYILTPPDDEAAACSETFRIRTAFLDIIFGPNDDGSLGKHRDGEFVVSNIDVPRGSEHFYVLFGRPVNPLVWQWNSGETTAKLSAFPYPNEQNDRIGDYDDN